MSKQTAFIGQSAFNSFEKVIEKYNPQTIFLVRGNASYVKSGAEERINSFFAGQNIDITEFMDYSVNPKIEEVETGLAVLRNKKIDMILSIGGGSALDIAKVIRMFFSFEKNGEDYEQVRELIPLIAVPTTAGTGSEATRFAVLYRNGQKCSIEHDVILPDVAIVDPVFTLSASPYLTACTGFDALAQAIEAYWNINATPESDDYALTAIELLWKNLPKVVHSSSIKTRNIVSEGAYWAGKAINITKTTAPHAFSYPFTTFYGYPHGHAVAMTFPFWADFNISVLRHMLPAKTDILLSQLNVSEYDICSEFVSYINSLSLDLRLPSTFSLDCIFSGIGMDRLKNNPGNLNLELIYRQINNYFRQINK
jgi:alcohol dehydrogenase class IV